MSKTLISAALFAAMSLTSLSAAAADGTITFSGNISTVTCTVKGGDNTDGGASDFTVGLPSVSTTALKAAGESAGDTRFSVVIGGAGQTGCTNGKVARLRFETTTQTIDAANGGRLKNTAAGGASNVLVGLLNKGNAPINLSNDAGIEGSKEQIAGNTATLLYTAQYYATAPATAGDVNTFVNYSVVYN